MLRLDDVHVHRKAAHIQGVHLKVQTGESLLS
jgi:hypothetical protein